MWVNTIFEAEYVRQLSPPVRHVYFNGTRIRSAAVYARPRGLMGRTYLPIPPPLERPMSFSGALFEPLMELALLPPAAALPPVGSKTEPGARADRCM
jgi:hypothetical protein